MTNKYLSRFFDRMKPRMHILKISIFSLNHVIVRPTKTPKSADWYDKIDQNTNFAKLASAKCIFCVIVTFIIQKLKFCKTAQLIIVSLSLAREILRGLRKLWLCNGCTFWELLSCMFWFFF